MGKFYESIPSSITPWLKEQHCFWVATAPLSGQGHVNVSPKGGPYFGVPDATSFWYLDLSGSGCETISHLHEPGNGRITVCFNAFKGPPRIVRLWGRGRALEFGSPEFDQYVSAHNIRLIPGTRSIIIIDIHQVGTSCGYSTPYYDFVDYRQTLNQLWEKRQTAYEAGKEEDGMDRYWAFKSQYSIDGLPGMKRGMEMSKRERIAPMEKMVGRAALRTSLGQPKTFTPGAVRLYATALLAFLVGAWLTLFVQKHFQMLESFVI